MPQPTRTRRRTRAAYLLIVALALPQLIASNASGDGVTDKRSEAHRIAVRLDSLRQRVEILAEEYDNAEIRLGRVRRLVSQARQAVVRTNREITKRQRDLARYAISAYTSGDDGGLSLMLNADGSAIGAREGYASAAVGDKADLVDSLRAAKSDGESRVADLERAQKHADDAQALVKQKRKATTAAVAETIKIYERVQGELKKLVEAEQARLAAAQQVRAEASFRVAGAQAAATARAQAQAWKVQTWKARSAAGVPTAAPTAAPAPPAPAPAPPPPPSPAPPAPAPVGQGASAAIAAARSVLGVRYTWGGASPATGFDCSGLVMWAWSHGGKSLPHSSQSMYGAARKIPLSAIQPGDLIFYGSPVHHVALYIGGGQIIHAPHTGSYVQVASMYYWSDLVGAGRV
jgi:cell wall-associated NlpC family hydrolase